MKQEEIKKILKPLIMECLNEILMGQVVKNAIQEAVAGSQKAVLTESVSAPRVEQKKPSTSPTSVSQKVSALREQRERLARATGMNLFYDVEPIQDVDVVDDVAFDPSKIDSKLMRTLAGLEK